MVIGKSNHALIRPKLGRNIAVVIALLTIGAGVYSYKLFGYVFHPIIKTECDVFIGKDADIEVLKDSLVRKDALMDMKAFEFIAKKKMLSSKIKPGKYHLKKGTTGNNLVNQFIAGNQSPIVLTFNNVRFFPDLAKKVASQLMIDSVSVLKMIDDSVKMQKFGFNKYSYPAMFVPNSYEMYWTISSEHWLDRMHKEYMRFWNAQRLGQAKKLKLLPVEVVTLASIVQEEVRHTDEMSKVAGVYVNRLKRGWPLQADPTIKFALGDFTISRILIQDLKIDSPYNTYVNKGLPPGPICFPSISAVDAVLNYTHHNYLYFCANKTFDGYHAFAKSYRQHLINARAYQNELNKRRIGFKSHRK
ncbi:endolytic transglycosylase MltG [Halosquirtibacter xylanolyticus]|uniref:endolytic transglycosylase MltG n=1 Tax=Halosquirtibacter xylanolyticus TaxID=3374599 RepID=UPI00374897B0|nr:endolytic transglycosylase MltG [Prolixibacteraceae bacterium]